jgi:predicted amidohydrolase YtcJ
MLRPLACLLLSVLASCSLPPPGPVVNPADLVLLDGRVHTLAGGGAPAQALAVRGNRIVMIGSSAAIRPLIGPGTRVVDLAGRPVYPGFADGHMHLSGYGHFLGVADLVGTTSEADAVARAAEHAAGLRPGAWVIGRGWDQNDWKVKDWPTHEALTAALPNQPAVLERIDGHALLANAAAMAAAGIDGDVAAPGGGRILRDEDGAPTGVFIDNATTLIESAIPGESREDVADGVQRAMEALHGFGITSVHDMGVSMGTVEVYRSLALQDRFDLRAHVFLSDDSPWIKRSASGLPTSDLTGQGLIAVRGIKSYADGALGSRGAALLADYTDEPGNTGLAVRPPDEIEDLARHALRKGWQLGVHAIGDRGNRTTLDAFEAALADVPEDQRPGHARDPRFRIEHAQILSPRDIPRFAKLGVIPAMQALHQTSDMPWAEDRVGPQRIRGAYAWRSLLDTGVILCGGSDCPVERPDPIAAFHAAVTRRNEQLQPKGGWYPQQVMTRDEALRHLTTWPAYAAFDEDRLGTLEVGKLADLVVVSGDLLTLPEDRLPDQRIDLTVFDGRVVYEHGVARTPRPAPAPTTR